MEQPLYAQLATKWFEAQLTKTANEIEDLFGKYRLSEALMAVYKLFWDEFSSWYLEMIKPAYGEPIDQKTYDLTLHFFDLMLRLLHPFMPFITEEIYCTLHPECDTIMTAKWPEYSKTLAFKKDEEAYSHIKDFVRAVRNVRTDMNVPPSKKAHVYVASEDKNIRETFNENSLLLSTLAGTSGISVVKNTSGVEGGTDSCVSQGIAGATLYLPIAELVDAEKEKERLTKEKERLLAELKRSDSMLNNERFLSKAPAEKVAAEKEKREKYQKMYDDLMSRLEKL
jgi:valyl-tRNA synthetase